MEGSGCSEQYLGLNWACMSASSLVIIVNEDTDMDSMITTFNTTVTETAGEILGNKTGSLQKFLIMRQKERTEKEQIRT